MIQTAYESTWRNHMAMQLHQQISPTTRLGVRLQLPSAPSRRQTNVPTKDVTMITPHKANLVWRTCKGTTQCLWATIIPWRRMPDGMRLGQQRWQIRFAKTMWQAPLRRYADPCRYRISQFRTIAPSLPKTIGRCLTATCTLICIWICGRCEVRVMTTLRHERNYGDLENPMTTAINPGCTCGAHNFGPGAAHVEGCYVLLQKRRRPSRVCLCSR